MRKFFFIITIAISLNVSPRAKADAWGADIPILLEILVQNISQLYQLYELVNRTQETIYLMKEINDGINDALGIVQQLRNRPDAGLYGDWDSVHSALQNLKRIYGNVPFSPNSTVQEHTDQAIAEAINMNSQLFSYADELDQIGQAIQSHSHSVSPKGAAKLTAQGMGIMLRAMNQQLRAQASGLKLQAQNLASENKKEKEETGEFLKTTAALSSSFKNQRTTFQTPRF